MSEENAKPVGPIISADLEADFGALRASLAKYLRRWVSDPALVDDLVQDVFVKASVAISANRAPSNLAGWLHAAARTTVADHYRSAKLDAIEVDENLPDKQPGNDELLHQELAACLRPLAHQLPEIYRDTLLATDFDGKTMQALANELGLSVSAIKSRASRARSMLRAKVLDCCHVELSGGVVTDFHQRMPEGSEGEGCC